MFTGWLIFFYSRKGLGVFSTDFLRRAYNYTRTDVIIHNVIIGFPFLTLVASICSGWWDLVEAVADSCLGLIGVQEVLKTDS